MSETKEQELVINHRGGHLLCPAVPGSGKTHTMVARVISLLNEGVSPERLLVMMFNVSAREDFQRRLKDRTEKFRLNMPEVQTFHAFGMKLCKAMESKGHIPHYKLEDKPWVFKRMAKAALIKANESLSGDEKISTDSHNVDELLAHIEYAKNEFKDFSKHDLPEISNAYIYAMRNFEEMRHEAKLRSFTDLMYDPAIQIELDGQLKSWVANRYDHIIGDEAQDMNRLQILLMSWIAGERATVCIVGDEDQSIYEWRGSKPEYMVHQFTEHFTNATRLPLTRTFRYGHSVAMLANHVISKNKLRTEKLCLPHAERHTDIVLLQADKTKSDGDHISDVLQAWTGEGRSYDEAVILVREYSHTVCFESKLLDAEIPYRIVGAEPFFNRREALAIRGALLLAGSGPDSIHDADTRRDVIQAMFTVPSSFLKTEVIEMISDGRYANSNSFLDAIDNLSNSENVSQMSKRKLKKRTEAWRAAISAAGKGNADQFISAFIDGLDLRDALFNEGTKPETALARYQTIIGIKDLASAYNVPTNEMIGFLDSLRIRYDSQSHANAVLVTSAHRAKGLEWPMVIIPQLKEGLFPSYDLDEGLSDQEMESERRLFYVACTRAEERLVLIGPTDSLLSDCLNSGKHIHPAYTKYYASRFLYESNLKWSQYISNIIQSGDGIESISESVVKIEAPQRKVIDQYLSNCFR